MVTTSEVIPLLRDLDWEGKVLSDGWKVASSSMIVTDKSSGASLGSIGKASPEEIRSAAASAANSQPGWAALSREERAAIMRRARDLFVEHTDEFAWWIIRETGLTAGKAQFEIALTVAKFDKIIGELTTSIFEEVLVEADGYRSFAERVPLGVVGVIGPFNVPVYLCLRAVIPALAFGNAVILKPDVQVGVCSGVLVARLFEAAGVPSGVLHVLPGGVDAGQALVADPDVPMIAFTGSSAAGRHIGQVAGGLLKRVSLELGGNSPFIVLEDADIEAAARCGAWGSFLHQGQICMAASRHIVHKSIAEKYAETLAEHARKLTVGDPALSDVHLGPIINEKQLNRVERIVSETVAKGAAVAAGGTHNGNFYAATVLTGVTPGMAAFDEEIFGPVAPITTFSTDEEAIALANRTEYGLSAAVHSKSLPRARSVAARLRTGMVHINDQTVNDDARAPFGGVGASGNGSRQGGHASLDEYTTWHWSTEHETPPLYPF